MGLTARDCTTLLREYQPLVGATLIPFLTTHSRLPRSSQAMLGTACTLGPTTLSSVVDSGVLISLVEEDRGAGTDSSRQWVHHPERGSTLLVRVLDRSLVVHYLVEDHSVDLGAYREEEA